MTKTTNRPRIETRYYVNAHGRSPRGNGMWAFSFGCDRNDSRHWAFFHGTFSTARAAALAEATRRGTTVVDLLP